MTTLSTLALPLSIIIAQLIVPTYNEPQFRLQRRLK